MISTCSLIGLNGHFGWRRTVNQYKLGEIRRSLIRALREEHGLTQARAAELAGIGSKQRWCNIERGNNGFGVCRNTLEKIAGVLKCAPADLVQPPEFASVIVHGGSGGGYSLNRSAEPPGKV
jgi:transcriptional regulator with XRE-family HTH domain